MSHKLVWLFCLFSTLSQLWDMTSACLPSEYLFIWHQKLQSLNPSGVILFPVFSLLASPSRLSASCFWTHMNPFQSGNEFPLEKSRLQLKKIFLRTQWQVFSKDTSTHFSLVSSLNQFANWDVLVGVKDSTQWRAAPPCLVTAWN